MTYLTKSKSPLELSRKKSIKKPYLFALLIRSHSVECGIEKVSVECLGFYVFVKLPRIKGKRLCRFKLKAFDFFFHNKLYCDYG